MNNCMTDGCDRMTRTGDMCAKHRTYTRSCATCSATFTTKNKKAMCCSGACGTANWFKNAPEVECETCGIRFKTKSANQSYCSAKCRPKSEPVEQLRVCTHCGDEYKTVTQRKTCSDECALDSQAAHAESLWSDLRRGYEYNDSELFFTALIADCDTSNDLGCWTWTRGRSAYGYPTAKMGGDQIRLHRASLEMAEGKPLGVLHSHHKCGNTMCVNPDHLEPATAAENTLEMLARNSYMARIAELEGIVAALSPGHEVLNRVATN